MRWDFKAYVRIVFNLSNRLSNCSKCSGIQGDETVFHGKGAWSLLTDLSFNRQYMSTNRDKMVKKCVKVGRLGKMCSPLGCFREWPLDKIILTVRITRSKGGNHHHIGLFFMQETMRHLGIFQETDGETTTMCSLFLFCNQVTHSLTLVSIIIMTYKNAAFLPKMQFFSDEFRV